VGARGSGEDAIKHGGFGSTVEAAYKIVDRAYGARVRPDSLGTAYQALPVSDLGNVAKYEGSIRSGIDTATAHIQAAIARWPSPCARRLRVLVAGYSQGAWVALETANGLSSADRKSISAVALFGNPDSWQGLRAAPASSLASDLRPKVHSYCVSHDPVCSFNSDPLSVPKLNDCIHSKASCPHFHYTDRPSGDPYADQAGRFLAGGTSSW
jgi:hypothetical protein